jgi:hypothetical protein
MMTTATASSGASGSFYFCKPEGHCHSTFNRGPGRRHRQNGFALVRRCTHNPRDYPTPASCAHARTHQLEARCESPGSVLSPLPPRNFQRGYLDWCPIPWRFWRTVRRLMMRRPQAQTLTLSSLMAPIPTSSHSDPTRPSANSE